MRVKQSINKGQINFCVTHISSLFSLTTNNLYKVARLLVGIQISDGSLPHVANRGKRQC